LKPDLNILNSKQNNRAASGLKKKSPNNPAAARLLEDQERPRTTDRMAGTPPSQRFGGGLSNAGSVRCGGGRRRPIGVACVSGRRIHGGNVRVGSVDESHDGWRGHTGSGGRAGRSHLPRPLKAQDVHDMFHSVILETVAKGGWTELAKPFVHEMFRPARLALVGTGGKGQ